MSHPERSTEERIKEAARAVFHRKGYAGTRTRDIAEEAGINLALLNYYFRSKDRLFSIIMLETFTAFFASVTAVVNDPDTSLEDKVGQLADRYIDMMLREPEIPFFLVSEMRRDPQALMQTVKLDRALMESVFFRQYESAVERGDIPGLPFLHFVINLLGMILFPFIANPMLKAIGGLDDTQFARLMEERKKMIPGWIRILLDPGANHHHSTKHP